MRPEGAEPEAETSVEAIHPPGEVEAGAGAGVIEAEVVVVAVFGVVGNGGVVMPVMSLVS